MAEICNAIVYLSSCARSDQGVRDVARRRHPFAAECASLLRRCVVAERRGPRVVRKHRVAQLLEAIDGLCQELELVELKGDFGSAR